MRSGTEKKPNPKSVSLSKFLRGRSKPVSKGYIYLPHGQIIRDPVRTR